MKASLHILRGLSARGRHWLLFVLSLAIGIGNLMLALPSHANPQCMNQGNGNYLWITEKDGLLWKEGSWGEGG